MKHVRASCSVCPGFVIFCEWAVVWYKKLGNENKRLATLYWCDRCVLSSIPVSLVAAIIMSSCLVILLEEGKGISRRNGVNTNLVPRAFSDTRFSTSFYQGRTCNLAFPRLSVSWRQYENGESRKRGRGYHELCLYFCAAPQLTEHLEEAKCNTVSCSRSTRPDIASLCRGMKSILRNIPLAKRKVYP